jgi:hypothetical protein
MRAGGSSLRAAVPRGHRRRAARRPAIRRKPGYRRRDSLRGGDPGLGRGASALISGNVSKSFELVTYLLRNGCGRLIFSSSAAIYQASEDLMVDEDSAIGPQCPYAPDKGRARRCSPMSPLRVPLLRYFNPIRANSRLRSGPQLIYQSLL